MNDTTARATAGSAAEYSALDRFLRQRLIAQMSKLRGGRLTLRDALGTEEIGGDARVDATHGDATETSNDLQIHIDVDDPGFYRAVAANGSVGAGEAFMDGHWRCDNLVALVRLFVRNRDLLDGMESGLARFGGWAMRLWHERQRNTRDGSRRNIAAHYDLGNDFFSLFLSPDLMYSSAIWAGDDDTLDAASVRKLDRICRKLELKPGDRVIEIGTGWGGFAIHAATHYGCHVTTTSSIRWPHDA
jgi:cyclopropane-fatty-acyl-phospholipid synthase